ncbi:Protein of unknown function (DUF3080) [Vreelandella songnenensis]|uniref:DUF3080 family protein n=1 Tax=Vreelandella songnenensis TaxID=1176243 RepID=A0A2T0UUV6_9GAMM|nr:DUF3080 family protein [Halomonas songnenensis]PRY61674.1 Protein of unknown function (DUF3080) [Halomonas songnenensis]
MTRGVWIPCLLTLMGALMAGCQGNDAGEPWVAYHQQLADDLSSPPVERSAVDNIGAFPEQRERLIPVEEIREGMLNIYALRECQITSLIAARNNQLGRVAPPSQHWLYERELWQRLDACLQSDVPDGLSPENRARLEQLAQLKTEQLPAVSWNALFDSEEWVKSFSRASSALDIRTPLPIDNPLAAIDYLQQMISTQFSHTWQQDSSELENHLKSLHQRPLTAEILRTLLLAAQRLNEASTYLTHQDPQAATCLSAWESAPLDQFEQDARTWLTAINQLITSQPIEPPDAARRYQARWLSLENDQAPWAQYQQARALHEATRDAHPQCEDN